MNIEQVREYCLKKPHATEDMPFGDDCVTFRVAGKIFGGISLSQGQVVQMKCSPEEFDELTTQYPFVQQAWHWAKRHWLQFDLSEPIPDALVFQFIDRAYELVFNKLPKKVRLSLEQTMNKIETTRLTLRNWKECDAERLYELAKDPSIGEAAGWPPHTSVEMSREVIRTVFNDENTFAIVLKSTGDIIGCIGLGFDANCPIAKDERILGYWLGVEYQGLGYTTEAAQSLIAKAFEDGIAGIWCGNFPENRASARVQEKCGFRFRFDDADKNWGMTDEGRPVTMRYLANDR